MQSINRLFEERKIYIPLILVGVIVAAISISCDLSLSQRKPSNEIPRCKGRYNTSSDDPRCYELQKQLDAAAWAGDVSGIREAIRNGADVNGGFYQSLSALTAAASQGKDDAVELLIQSGAEINNVEGIGNTALKSAVSFGHKETVKILLENGADVCEKTESTALQYAIESDNTEIIDMLVKAGAKECR